MPGPDSVRSMSTVDRVLLVLGTSLLTWSIVCSELGMVDLLVLSLAFKFLCTGRGGGYVAAREGRCKFLEPDDASMFVSVGCILARREPWEMATRRRLRATFPPSVNR